MIQTEHISFEIVTLAEQQLEALKRRFPHVSTKYHILRNHPDVITVDPYYLRVEITEITGRNNRVRLVVSFLDSSIVIMTYCPLATEVINYADPRFTDDTIADILGRLG